MSEYDWADAYLYGIVDTGYVEEGDFENALRELAQGGVRIVQFRAKGHEPEWIEAWCRRLAPLARELGVLFIVNDYVEIARDCDADGVHIGQDDGDLASARALLGEEKIIGRSTHSYEQAVEAYREGFDYIGFGPLFPTMTKPGRPAIGLEDIARVHRELPRDFPVFCIGGVQPDRMESIRAAGARRVVVVSWLLRHPDRVTASRKLIDFMKDGV